jgi:hypothetical protein
MLLLVASSIYGQQSKETRIPIRTDTIDRDRVSKDIVHPIDTNSCQTISKSDQLFITRQLNNFIGERDNISEGRKAELLMIILTLDSPVPFLYSPG